MVISQLRPKRKPSGGRYKDYRKKKLNEKGNLPILTKLGDKKAKNIKGMGYTEKRKLLNENTANILDPKTGKFVKAKIKSIVETPANRNYARRNIMTKGTVIETEIGKAEVSSRPGQDGVVNAVLVK
jgi:small subunit ribosomal protein S8e